MSGSSRDVRGRGVAMVLSPSLDGHRATYCAVLARSLRSLGFETIVATWPGSDPDAARRWKAVEASGARLVDLDGRLAPDGVELAGLAALTEELRAELTLLTEADDLIAALADRRARRPRWAHGRVVGLFIRSTNYIYEPAPGALAAARRSLADLRDRHVGYRAFHERLLPRYGIVDAALVLDEVFAAQHPGTHRWLPDIFRAGETPPAASADETTEWDEKLQRFLSGLAGRPVVVYVGRSQARHGYDTLLRLALDEDACFVHCGRRDGTYESGDPEVAALRAALEGRGALLETAAPYASAATADLFFRAARCVVFPYRHHLGSSGAMLQAVAAGRPVLVPDRGLMAYRVSFFGLGETYRDGDADDLRRRFRELHARGPAPYARRLRGFLASFSQAHVDEAVAAAVSGQGPGASLPQEGLGNVGAGTAHSGVPA